MKVTLVSSDQASFELDPEAVRHFGVFTGMASDLGSDQDVTYGVPLSGQLLGLLVQLAAAHRGDEPVPDNWRQLPPREINAADTALLGELGGLALIELMRTASLLHCQLLLNCVARRFGAATEDMTPAQIQDWVGVHIVIGAREREHLRAIYPAAYE